MAVSLNEAKKYLRIDFDDDDTLIRKFIRTGERLCRDTLRIGDDDPLEADAVIRVAILYSVAYLYEHRENADMDELTRSLRYILATKRKAAF